MSDDALIFLLRFLGFLVLLSLLLVPFYVSGAAARYQREAKARQARERAAMKAKSAAAQADRARHEQGLDPRVPSSYGELLEREKREARSGRQGTGRR